MTRPTGFLTTRLYPDALRDEPWPSVHVLVRPDPVPAPERRGGFLTPRLYACEPVDPWEPGAASVSM